MKTTCSQSSLTARMTGSVNCSQPLSLMRGSTCLFNRQHAVEQQYALARPVFEKPVPRWRNAKVALQFLVDIDGGTLTIKY